MSDQTGKMLVVESDDPLRAILVAVLGDTAYKVLTDNREGMKTVIAFEPDLVILGADPSQLEEPLQVDMPKRVRDNSRRRLVDSNSEDFTLITRCYALKMKIAVRFVDQGESNPHLFPARDLVHPTYTFQFPLQFLVKRVPNYDPGANPTALRPAHPLLRLYCRVPVWRERCFPGQSGAELVVRSDARRAPRCPCG